MRPIDRGDDPSGGAWRSWQGAGALALTRQIGLYCSYCERYLPYAAAVEHVRPKKPNPGLATEWDNWLIACPNCNSVKGDTNVVLDDYVWPDRDNTASAFAYGEGGVLEVAETLAPDVLPLADGLLTLVGLDRRPGHPLYSELDRRWLDRRDAYDLAVMISKDELTPHRRTAAIAAAKKIGFFSTWMTVFADDDDMRRRLVAAFAPAADCYDANARLVARPGGRC